MYHHRISICCWGFLRAEMTQHLFSPQVSSYTLKWVTDRLTLTWMIRNIGLVETNPCLACPFIGAAYSVFSFGVSHVSSKSDWWPCSYERRICPFSMISLSRRGVVCPVMLHITSAVDHSVVSAFSGASSILNLTFSPRLYRWCQGRWWMTQLMYWKQ